MLNYLFLPPPIYLNFVYKTSKNVNFYFVFIFIVKGSFPLSFRGNVFFVDGAAFEKKNASLWVGKVLAIKKQCPLFL